MARGKIPESFIQELRDRLPVSQVVMRRCKDLKRAGSEWKCLSPFNKEKTPSFTVNDSKQLWKDFSSDKGGDIYEFEMQSTGCTFMQSVETLAQLAGIPLPGADRPGRPAASAHEPHPNEPNGHGDTGAPSANTRREITAAYDYTDDAGGLLYQVCRLEWLDAGKRKKSFLQRRKAPTDAGGGWIWGLDEAEYIQGRNKDWYSATDDRRAKWSGSAVRIFDGVAHGLYRLPQLAEELAQPGDEQRIIFSPEGEKDCDTLAAWGLVATDSSGGSKKWSPHHAEQLRDADVVVLIDNDRSGREYGHRKAASLRGIARRVRVLDWRAQWKECPEGADVTDWRAHAGGSKDKLFAIVDLLADWLPVPPESSFNAIRFVDLDKPARELEWLIKKILTRGEVSIWYGPPSCGKSFLITDAALSIARGVSWMGMRVRPGLAVYQAGEGGLGLKKRLRAYRRHHKIKHDDNLPFVLLPSRVDLFGADDHTNKLIEEIKSWAAFYDAPLELVVIDTFSAASPGANENASEDVSKVLQRCHRMAIETGAHVALVHHTPKLGGSPRGHSSLLGNVENAVEVIRTEQVDSEEVSSGRVQRDIREMVVTKQKDAEGGITRRFVLKQINLGPDQDGEPDTSCVVHELVGPAAPSRTIPHGYIEMRPNNQIIMRALVNALRVKGAPAPAEANTPHGQRCVRVGEWIDALCEIRFSVDPADPDGRKLRARCKKAIERTYADYQWNTKMDLIGKSGDYVWRTHRKVHGVDEPPVGHGARPEPVPSLLAPGEPQFEEFR
jgi:hypothetical protein